MPKHETTFESFVQRARAELSTPEYFQQIAAACTVAGLELLHEFTANTDQYPVEPVTYHNGVTRVYRGVTTLLFKVPHKAVVVVATFTEDLEIGSRPRSYHPSDWEFAAAACPDSRATRFGPPITRQDWWSAQETLGTHERYELLSPLGSILRCRLLGLNRRQGLVAPEAVADRISKLATLLSPYATSQFTLPPDVDWTTGIGWTPELLLGNHPVNSAVKAAFWEDLNHQLLQQRLMVPE